jgi:hypothetical protein
MLFSEICCPAGGLVRGYLSRDIYIPDNDDYDYHEEHDGADDKYEIENLFL